MTPRRTVPLLVAVCLLAAAGCSSEETTSETTTDPPATTSTPAVTEAPTTANPDAPGDTPEKSGADDEDTVPSTTVDEPDTNGSDEPNDAETSILEPRAGTWVVGDAGEVEFDVTDAGLVLVDVRANDGWRVSIDEESADEIEVDFERDNVEWEIEIEFENGVLEIEIDQDIDPAEPGVVQAGEAGTVEFDLVGSTLELIDVVAADGWTVASTEVEADEIEVVFANGLAEFEVEIEFDDGRIEIEVDFEVEGPISP